jgi:hypothetical protein
MYSPQGLVGAPETFYIDAEPFYIGSQAFCAKSLNGRNSLHIFRLSAFQQEVESAIRIFTVAQRLWRSPKSFWRGSQPLGSVSLSLWRHSAPLGRLAKIYRHCSRRLSVMPETV